MNQLDLYKVTTRSGIQIWIVINRILWIQEDTQSIYFGEGDEIILKQSSFDHLISRLTKTQVAK